MNMERIERRYARLPSLFSLVLISCFSRLVIADWIDPDTPKHAYTTLPKKVPPKSPPGFWRNPPTEPPTFSPTLEIPDEDVAYKLVMSDEFNVPDRTFEDGSDPKWTALNKNDYTNDALHYYSPENAMTDENGDLVITTEAKDTPVVGFNDVSGKKEVTTKHFKSAMLQSWNKFCFTGGIIEAEAQMPGKQDVSGLWPALWLLGNMARHTYVGSTNHMWPWSSDICNEKSMNAQRVSACMKAQHFGLDPNVGRGSPEIDIFEVQGGPTPRNTAQFLESAVGQPFASTSYQVAPGRSESRPGGGWWPGPGQWYDGLQGGSKSNLNIYFYGNYNHVRNDSATKDYWSDAISYNYQLDESHFTSKHKYRLEWGLPDEDKNGSDGYLRWYIDGVFAFGLDGSGIVDAGYGGSISSEPMYIIMNTAISKQWGFSTCPANCPCEEYDCNSNKFAGYCGFPPGFCKMMKEKDQAPQYKLNYVRVYQDPKNPRHKVGCSTPERPTSKYIKGHQHLYKQEQDLEPIKPITIGRGICNPEVKNVSRASCGGESRGICTEGLVCECKEGWTGPHCLSHAGYNPIMYEVPESLKFSGPYIYYSGLWTGLLALGIVVVLAPTLKGRMDGWTPVRDVQ